MSVSQVKPDGSSVSISAADADEFKTDNIYKDASDQVTCVLNGETQPTGFAEGERIHFQTAEESDLAITIFTAP